MSDMLALLTLRLAGLPRRPIRELVSLVGSPRDLVEAPQARLRAWLGRWPRALDALLSGLAREAASREAERARRLGLSLLGCNDEAYPLHLAQTADPPLVLWVRGNPQSLAASPAVAVVGSRRPSPEGRHTAHQLGRGLAAHGVTVVSGLARGIDAAAHRGALEAKGPTLAVLGSALDVVYPRGHRRLAEGVARAGALVSEYPLGTAPRPWHFPERNRILAGLVQAVVVVEAAARSGALITAHLALEEGREVLAVPGAPWDPGHQGTNALIQEGAALVQGLADVLAAVGLGAAQPRPEAHPAEPLTDKERQVLSRLSPTEPCEVEQIASATGLTTAEILGLLSTLELKEYILADARRGYLRLAPGRLLA